jgi:hypothetical protein
MQLMRQLGRRPHEPRSGSLLATALALAAAAAAAGCDGAQPTPGGRLSSLDRSARAWSVGQVTLTGQAGRVFGARAFTLRSPELLDGAEVLVVAAEPIEPGDGGIQSGQDIEVTGDLRPLVVQDRRAAPERSERRALQKLGAPAEPPFRTRPILVARAVTLREPPGLVRVWHTSRSGRRVPAAAIGRPGAAPRIGGNEPSSTLAPPWRRGGAPAVPGAEEPRRSDRPPEAASGPEDRAPGEKNELRRRGSAPGRGAPDGPAVGTAPEEPAAGPPYPAATAALEGRRGAARGDRGPAGSAALLRTPAGLRVGLRLSNLPPGWYAVFVRDHCRAPDRRADDRADDRAGPEGTWVGDVLVGPDGEGGLARTLSEPGLGDEAAWAGRTVAVRPGRGGDRRDESAVGVPAAVACGALVARTPGRTARP